jgi:hypothetical protein
MVLQGVERCPEGANRVELLEKSAVRCAVKLTVPCRPPVGAGPRAGRLTATSATPAADLMALAFFCGLRPGEIGRPPLGRL